MVMRRIRVGEHDARSHEHFMQEIMLTSSTNNTCLGEGAALIIHACHVCIHASVCLTWQCSDHH